MFKSIFSKNQIDSLNAFYNSKSSVNAVYSEYTALLNDPNSGGLSVFTLFNNLGQVVTITNPSTGVYNIDVTGNIFNDTKMYYSVTNNNSDKCAFVLSFDSASRIILRTYFNGALSNDLMWRTPLTIRIYK